MPTTTHVRQPTKTETTHHSGAEKTRVEKKRGEGNLAPKIALPPRLTLSTPGEKKYLWPQINRHSDISRYEISIPYTTHKNGYPILHKAFKNVFPHTMPNQKPSHYIKPKNHYPTLQKAKKSNTKSREKENATQGKKKLAATCEPHTTPLSTKKFSR